MHDLIGSTDEYNDLIINIDVEISDIQLVVASIDVYFKDFKNMCYLNGIETNAKQ